MNFIELVFQGYTWDRYFYVIAQKSGILITYKGCLDSEDAVRLNEIVSVDGGDCIGDIYYGSKLRSIREKLNPGDMLFFSLAEIYGEEREKALNILQIKITNNDITQGANVVCKDACALL